MRFGARPSPSDSLVIFYCDGVLVDSERLGVAIDVRRSTPSGGSISEADVIDRHLGRSHADVLAGIETHLGRAVPEDWVEAWNTQDRRVPDE